MAKSNRVKSSKDYARFLAEFDEELRILTQKIGEAPKKKKSKSVKKKAKKATKKKVGKVKKN